MLEISEGHVRVLAGLGHADVLAAAIVPVPNISGGN